MAKERFYIKEFAQEEFNSFLATPVATALINNITEFTLMDRDTTAELARVQSIISTHYLMQRIAFAIVSAQETTPFETMIGVIASVLTGRDKSELLVLDAHTVASEYILFSSNLTTMSQSGRAFEINQSYNSKLIVKNLFADSIRQSTFYPLPNLTPTTYHKALGKYKWSITEDRALNKLNSVPFTILNISEAEPTPKYDSHWDMKADKPNEQWMKWAVRQQIIPNFKGQRFYFNWHSDFRGRMYAGGYHINPQGNSYEKNIIAFADVEDVTWSGSVKIRHAVARAFKVWKQWDQIELLELEIKHAKNSISTCIASNLPHVASILNRRLLLLEDALSELNADITKLDKLTDPEKLQWFIANESLLLQFVDKAHNSTEAQAQLESWRLFRTHGFTNIPSEIDATTSFLQIASVLIGDLKSATVSNVVSDNKSIRDAYQVLADNMSTIINGKLSA